MRLLPLVCTALFLAACEHGIDVEGTITAPPAVQALFSTESPGQFVVTASGPGYNAQIEIADRLCEPADHDREIRVRSFSFGCAQEGMVTVTAWALPRPAAEVDCATPAADPPPRLPKDSLPGLALASATADVPMQIGSGAGKCHDGLVSFALTLAPSTTP